jgi:hypothetical protein
MFYKLTRLALLGSLSLGLLAGCATSDSAAVYSQGQMRRAQTVELGTVVSVNNVKMEGKNNELLTLGGAALAVWQAVSWAAAAVRLPVALSAHWPVALVHRQPSVAWVPRMHWK